MAGAPLEKTRTPGIFRRGSKYVVVYWVDGRQKREAGNGSSTPCGRPALFYFGRSVEIPKHRLDEPPPLGESLLNRLERTARIR